MPFPYDEEEERRRRMLPIALPTPLGGAERLPEAEPRRPMLSPPGGIPGGEVPDSPVEFSRPTRLQRYESEKEGYMRGTPGRGRSALTGALQGFLGGGGLIGAGLGAAEGAIDPRAQRERQFNRLKRPELMEQFAFEDADIAAGRQAESDALNADYRRAQIGDLESQAEKNRRPAPPPMLPRPLSTPRGALDLGTNTIIPGTEPLPSEPRELAPRPVVNDRGEYVDFNAETKAGRKVKAFQKPKAAPKAKEEPKVVSMTKIREYMKATGKSRSDAIADAMRDGYRIAK